MSLLLYELVRFGFSDSTGNSFAIHTFIHGILFQVWILAVGLGSGGFFLVGGLAMVLFALWKRSRRNNEEHDVLDDSID